MIPQNVYLASRYSRKEEMREHAFELRSFGSRVTSSWLDETYESGINITDLTNDVNRDIAEVDLSDITSSDVLIFFAEDQNNQPPRGGRHVEFGYALANGLTIYVIGEKENIFHYLPNVKEFPTWESFVAEVYL